MRTLTEIENQNESYLIKQGIRFVKVLMTENILSHHIFDATQPIVRFLKEEGVHDFDSQKSGEKRFVLTHLLTFKRESIINTSVYKSTKRGDKRMWFGAEIIPITIPNDIILMTAKDGDLYILNMSHVDIMFCSSTGINNPIKDLVHNY